MKLKHIAILLLAVTGGTAVLPVSARKMSDLRIYINPGHGGYDSDDRPIQIYPFASGDSAGYWESKSNLYKGLHMYYILDSLGAKPFLSRIKNTTKDDRSLSGIASEANSLDVDLFFSIHSNAGENVNYPLMLYRENEIGVPRYPENVTLSKIVWKNLHSNKLPIWTRDTEYICGDLDFYKNMWQGGLGVLRTLYVPGLLSEGGMHEHRPEAHRLMNDDYWWLEAWHFVRSIMEFFDTEDRFVTGNVAGIVYDDHNLREMVMPVNFTRYGRDDNAPLNGAFVELLDQDGNVVQKRTTDNMYNGVFVFRNVKPGNYKLRASMNGYYTRTDDVTVTANEVTYNDMAISMKREMPLEVTEFSPVAGSDGMVSCASHIVFKFNTDVDQESFKQAVHISPEVAGYWMFSNSYRQVEFVPELALQRSTEYTVTVDASAKTADPFYSHPQLEAPLTYTFLTRGRDKLELIDNFPADGGEVHIASPTLEFRFDMTLASAASDKFTVTDSDGKTVSINKRSSKQNTLTNNYGNAILALGNLTEGKEYTVTMSKDLRDKEDIPTGTSVSTRFKAVDVKKAGNSDNTVVCDFEKTGMDFAYDPDRTSGITATLPTAVRSTSDKFFDTASGKFGYSFAASHGGEIVWNYSGEPVRFNTNDVIGMYVKGDFNNHELYVGVSAGTNKKYYKVCDLNFLGWQYFEVTLNTLEADFCPFLLSEFKLVQTESPITQKGSFCIDNIATREGTQGGVSDLTADGRNAASVVGLPGAIAVSGAEADAAVRIYSPDGKTVAAAIGNATVSVAPGIYVVTVGSASTRVVVK